MSLMIGDIEHLFMYLLVIYMTSLERNVLTSLAQNLIHFVSIFKYMRCVQFQFFACRYPIFLTQFIEAIIISPFCVPGILVKDQLIKSSWIYSLNRSLKLSF